MLCRRPKVHDYVDDIRASMDGAPFIDNLFVSVYRWMLLAGFILIPQAFEELQKDLHKPWISKVSHLDTWM